MKGTDNKKKMSGTAGLSVWALLARSSFCKILTIVFFVSVAELVLFYQRLHREGGVGLLETEIEGSGTSILFLGALGVVFFILIRAESLLDSAGRYTMMRLRVTQVRLFAIKTAYNVLCLLVLFTAQVWLVFGMFWLYGRQAGVENAPQLLFMAFYRSEFLHCLLPMAETGKWLRNILLLLAFGIEAAGGIGKRNQATQAALFVLTAIWFTCPIGTGWQELLCDIVYLVTIAADVREVYAFQREVARIQEV